MDQDTADHFYAWLTRVIPKHLQSDVACGVARMVDEDPTLLDTHSWPEIARLADVW